MGRPVILSNGHILVGLDDAASVHDFYYPYVGLDNLTSARNLKHKIGVWVGGNFSWLDDGNWQIDMDFEEQALISQITAVNDKLRVNLHFQDFVDSHYPTFCRIIKVENLADEPAEIRLFMHQAFQISRAGRSDTALYVPRGHYLLDYKGWSSLLIYGEDATGNPFDQFAVGNYGIEGKEGTFRDAEDGELSGSLVEHGGVDSVIRIKLNVPAHASNEAHYWVVASDSQLDAEEAHKAFLNKGALERLQSTRQSFIDWLDTARPQLEKIDPKYRPLATKSLLVVKSHIDKHGGIIASCDSSIYNYGRDYYCYVWPRDGAYAILPLIDLGFKEEPKRFIEFCAATAHPRGYMMHKYQPDRAIGSTWHPQLHMNHPELPIQEDETAMAICALARYVVRHDDWDFARSLYAGFIKPAAGFMSKFIDEETRLPHASYDLWEQKFATFTYSVFVTLMALKSAARIAEKLGFHDDNNQWMGAASTIESGLDELINDQTGAYRKSLLVKPGGQPEPDDTIDASSFFGALQYYDGVNDNLRSSVRMVEEKLLKDIPIQGVPRYEHDDYFLSKGQYVGNPWIITTLWLAQYCLKDGQSDRARQLMDWVVERAGPSGMLSEQVDPEDGSPLGVNPLAWSHSTFLETAIKLSESNG
ncbi:MAG TPA: glycoside hydrolase family 15 protein [Candidatus Saccharimonadales bacterium]|nr:glycoside hydrolase family 15 protein [Candidatus Saccharimonadales bacterium]